MERFGLLNAFAQSTDYRALVCIFLFGGNDSGNVVIPYDDYATYASARQASGIAIPQSSLLQISPASISSRFGLHPSLSGLSDLWNQRKLAVVCNVGPLVQPTTRGTYINGSARLPVNLFSHSDQQNEWQTSIADPQRIPPGSGGGGWGGRLADKIGGRTARRFRPSRRLRERRSLSPATWNSRSRSLRRRPRSTQLFDSMVSRTRPTTMPAILQWPNCYSRIKN